MYKERVVKPMSEKMNSIPAETEDEITNNEEVNMSVENERPEPLSEPVEEREPHIEKPFIPDKQVLKKSLDDAISLKTLMIGIGNAGNQTVAYAAREGMDAFAINTSSRDLNDIIMDETIPCFIVGASGRGSGKNIKEGIALFKENGRNLFKSKTFLDKCQKADIIYVTSSTGGGTGPAVSPEICRILQRMFDKKIIMYHGIVPKNSDSNVAFSNSSYCLNEINKLNIPYLLTDLEKFAGDGYEAAFKKADKHVVECAKAVAGKYLVISSSQMIDENDLKTIVSEPGYMGVYTVPQITSHDLEKKTMQSMLIDQIKNGPSVMIQKDGISMQMGVILSCPDDMDDVTKAGNYDELYKFIGHRPKNGVYENYSCTEGTNGSLKVIISGMTYPINRLNEYTRVIKEQDEFLRKQKTIDTDADAQLMQDLVSNDTSKLDANSAADETTINNVLDEYF